jgi:hypothetical protein
MKRRNDAGPKNTVKMLRSQSTSSIETTSGEATPPGTLSDKPPKMKQRQRQPEKQAPSDSDTAVRRRRAASEVRNSKQQIAEALQIQAEQSDQSEGKQESMAQRMERRRRSRPSAATSDTVPYSDIQNRIQQREQLVVGQDNVDVQGHSNDAERRHSTSQLPQDPAANDQRSRRRYSIDSALDDNQQMMQAKTAQVMVAQNANAHTPRRRRQGRDEMTQNENTSNNNHNVITRSRSVDQSTSINQLAQGKLPRDRSPIVQSNPNFIPMQQLTNMAFRQRSRQGSDLSSADGNMSGNVSPDVFLPSNTARPNGGRIEGDPQTTSQFRDVLRSRRSRASSEESNGNGRQPMFGRTESEGSLSSRARDYPVKR